MRQSADWRWRKASDVNRAHALFELLHFDKIVLDLGLSNEGTLEIAFHSGVAGKIIDGGQFLALLEEGRALVEDDR